MSRPPELVFEDDVGPRSAGSSVSTTTLDDDDEQSYREWMKKIGHTKDNGFFVDENFTGTNYDYRGYFKKNGAEGLADGEHLTDEFKLPNHETFSVESIYATGENAARAGRWDGDTFIPPGAAAQPRFDELKFEDDVLPKQVAPEVDTELSFEDDPLAPRDDPASMAGRVVQTFKTGVAGLSTALLGFSKSVLETPRTAARILGALEEGWKGQPVTPDGISQYSDDPEATAKFLNDQRDFSIKYTNPYAFPKAVMEWLSEGGEVGSFRYGGFGTAADELNKGMEALPELFPSFRRLGVKGQEADAAASALIDGNPELMKKVALDPEAWAGFLGQGIPSLLAAWKSGGSIPFMAWLEGMGAADSATDFEKETGVRMTDGEFATAVVSVGAANAFLEKMGLDSILGKYGETALGKLLTGFVGEGGTEMLQEITSNASAFLYDPELRTQAAEAIDEGEWEPFLKSMSTGVVPALMGGTALGGAASTARVALEQLGNRNKTERVRAGEGTDEQTAEAGLEEVPVTHELLERVAQGEPLDESEQYTIVKQGLGRFANDDRVVLVKDGLDAREELKPTTEGEHIVMEGDEFTTAPVDVEDVVDDVDRRVTFSKKDDNRTVRFNKKRLDRGANYAATSELNELPTPTPEQVAAGNYRKGHVRVQGLEVSIENPKGSVREGKGWQQKMADHYGYIRGTVGKDKDHIDVFLGPNAYSEQVYVVNQNKPDGTFDEHKVVLGYTSKQDAIDAYHANYPKGWKGLGSVASLGMDDFKAWLGSNRTKQPIIERSARDEVQDLKPIAKIKSVPAASKESRAAASTNYQEQAEQGPFTTRDGRTVRMTNVGMKKARSHSADPNVLAVMPHISALIENSVPVKTVARSSTSKGDSIRAYHHYAGKVMIDGKHHFVKVTLRENKDGSVVFYDTDVTPGDQMLKPPKSSGFDLAGWWQQGLNVGAQKPKFKTKAVKTNAGNGIQRQELLGVVKLVSRYFQGAPDLEVVEGFEDLPQHIRSRVPDSEKGLITGVYDQDAVTETVYLVANNIDSYQQGIETLLHEYVGHYGLQSVLGDNYNSMMDRVYDRFGDEVRSTAQHQGLDWTNLKERRVAAEEYIAYTAQMYLSKKPLTKRAADLLRQFIEELKKLIDRVMGTIDPVVGNQMTERDLHRLIARAYDYVHHPSGHARAQRRGLRRNMENPVFFSNLFKLINDDPAKAMSPSDWTRVIDAHVKNGRLREEELKWSGLKEAIESMSWGETVRVLANAGLPLDSLVPADVLAAWRKTSEMHAKYEAAQAAFNDYFREHGAASLTDEAHPNYAEMTKIREARFAAETEGNDAEGEWSRFENQMPKKLPKEVILQQISAHGVELHITKNGGPSDEEDDPDRQTSFEIDTHNPDEDETSSDEDMMEAWSDWESNNYDDTMMNEQIVNVLRNGVNNSRYSRVSFDWDNINYINDEGQPAYDEDKDKLDDSELLELAKDWYEENDSSEWDRIQEKAQEYYYEAFSDANYNDFVRDWEQEHSKKTWSVGIYTVTLQNGMYNVYNTEGDYEVGEFRSESRAETGMEEDYAEQHGSSSESRTKWSSYMLEDGRDYEEWLFRWKNPSKLLYQSSHWDDENVLAHARFDVRYDRDGNEAIFIDEIQSDWHQALRDEGEKSSPAVIAQLEKDIIKYRSEYRAKLEPLYREMLGWNLDVKTVSRMQTAPGPFREQARDYLGELREQLSREEVGRETAASQYETAVRKQVFARHRWDEEEGNNDLDWQTRNGWDGTSYDDMRVEARQIVAANPFDPEYELEQQRRDFNEDRKNVIHMRHTQTTWESWVTRMFNNDYVGIQSGLSDRDRTSMQLAAIYASIAPTLLDNIRVEKDLVAAIDGHGIDVATTPLQRQLELRRMANVEIPVGDLMTTESMPLQEDALTKAQALTEIKLELHEREDSYHKGHEGIDAAPFSKTWQLFVIKALIREAVDRGHSSLFMAPGEVHGVRWSGSSSVASVEWNITMVDKFKLDAKGKKILLKADDPRYVAGEVIYDFEQVPGFAVYGNTRGSTPITMPANKLSSVVGGDVARVINDAVDQGGTTGNVPASQVGRNQIFIPNGQRDTLTGGREIYNVITPNLINKFIKKYGTEMKLGFVKSRVAESKGVKQLKHRKDREPHPYDSGVIRQLTNEEQEKYVTGSSGSVGQPVGGENWYGFEVAGSLVSDIIGISEDWVSQRVERFVSHDMDMSGFEAWEIKISDKLRDAAKGGFPLFMKKYPSAKLNKAMQWADKNVGPRGPSGVEKMQRRVNNVVSISNKAAKLEQAFVDQFAGIKWALKETYGEELPAERSGYKQAHFSTGVDSQIYAFMTHGSPVWKNGVTAIKEGSKGFLEILEPVAAHIDEYYLWRAAIRASRLMKEGREHLFGEAEIEGLLELSTYHPEFIEVAVEEAKWRGDFLDWAQAGGAIDPTTRQLWDNADYVPFFRLKADELGGSFTRTSGVGGRGIANQFNPIKRLKGGSQPLGNLLENVVMNFTHIASTTMKNRAAALTIENLEGTGLIEPVKGTEFMQKSVIDMGDLKRKLKAAGVDWKALDEDALHAMRQMWTITPPTGDDIVSVLVGGKKKYFHIKDELLFRSLTAINTQAFNSTFAKIMMAPFRVSKRFVTSMITLAPDFIAANVLRDTVSSFIVSRHAHWPRFEQNALGAWKAFVEDTEMVNMMASGGAIYAGYVNALDPAATAKAIKRSLRKQGFGRSLLNTPKKLFDVYQRLGSASENASRIGMAYIPAKKRGLSDAEASWQALDLMNFRKHGDNAVMQFLIQTVPFMNARIQGLVRAGQRFKEAPGITALKGMLVMVAALALFLRNRDDERYKELADDDKDLYFHFWIGDHHYRLPKPFEVGMIFATGPERMMEYFLSNEDDAGKLALNRLSFVFDQVFMLYDPVTIVPTPALIEPLIEVNLNKNFFFQAPIVPEYMQDIGLVKPEQVYDDTTSPLMREIAQLSPKFLPNNMRNPMMLEHLAQAYGGTLTSYAVMMADDLVRQAYDYPARPALMWSQMPVAGRFYRGTEPPRRTGYENILYEVRQNARAIDRAITQMEDRELQDEADAFLTEGSEYNRRFTNEQIQDSARDMEPNYNEIRRIRKEMTEIWNDPAMSPQQKLDQLNQLYRDKANEARDAYQLRPGASQEQGEIGQLIDNIRGLKPDEAAEKLRALEKPATADLVASLPRVTSAALAKALDG